MSRPTRSLITIIGLILATTAALAAITTMEAKPVEPVTVQKTPGLTLSGEVVQEKILKGGDGRVTVALRLVADRLPQIENAPQPKSDLVIVLDRSGSMQGQKLNDAGQAVVGLLDQLGPDDRLALVTYSDGVQTPAALTPITGENHRRLVSLARSIRAGGGTNLGGGLERGIQILMASPAGERQRKIILISDGLANQGITDPAALGRMASASTEHRFSVSTVGVGLDFNELLMTTIADFGAGSYHFMENPQAFAGIFEAELMASRRVAVADLSIRIPLSPGVRLVDAGGYPIRQEGTTAIIHPGELLSAQERTLYLTFTTPVDREGTLALGHLQATYSTEGGPQSLRSQTPLTVACVNDEAAAMASIKKEAWADQVVREEFSRLKEAVADDIRNGDRERAEKRIQDYTAKQSAINAVVGSGKVAENLETEVSDLSSQVDDTFSGPAPSVARKQKQAAKSLQYDSYQTRRDKK